MYIANHVYPAAFVTVGFGARYNSLLLFEPAPYKMVHVTSSLFFVIGCNLLCLSIFYFKCVIGQNLGCIMPSYTANIFKLRLKDK